MANHKSSIKRIRANNAKRTRNRYQKKTVTTLIKKIKSADTQDQFMKELPQTIASIDKLAKKNVFHKNKASHLKSQLMKKAKSMAAAKSQ